jgi:acyl-CoA reductase-like NAD-dependent aldehyde dehydrogenase
MEVSGIVPFFDYHVTLDIPEDRDEDDEKVITTRYTPIGVVGGIVPWNFPIGK